jgi:hypothetical protein
MSSTTTSIFTFDHGQKKMNKAIGVEEVYMDDLQEQIADLLKNYLFDEDKNIKDDLSPSMLIELALHEFSYNQLVVIAGMYLQQRLDGFTKMMEEKLKGVVKKISLDADDVPEDIRDLLIDLAKNGHGDSKGNAINGDDLPQEVKDFLDSIARNSEDADDDD